MYREVLKHGRPLAEYRVGLRIHGSGKMAVRKGYSYVLEAPAGKEFATGFTPVFTPEEMLFLGVFEGKYLNDGIREFPAEWYLHALAADKLRPGGADITVNYFGVGSRQPLAIWRENGWAPRRMSRAEAAGLKGRERLADPLFNPDERGWFQWYCRYWCGRRMPELDAIQIARWRSFARHAGAVRHGCTKGDLNCRRRERQALLQWAYDPFL